MSPEGFGRVVLGPVFGEFALRLHLYLLGLERPQDARLLFCARGGLRLRVVYEAFLKAAGLPSPVGYADFMVSRLVAARTALARRAEAAYDEIAREFAGDRLGDAVRALTQAELPLGAAGDAPFTTEAFEALLRENDDLRHQFWGRIAQQNELFDQHLRACAGASKHMILCDTGLYGSTVRLLLAGRSDYEWSCALFARSNYKGFSESHFPVTAGLCVEANGYSPAAARSGVLRYWHLIESTLEPDLPSVVEFTAGGGEARANLITPGWEERLQPGRGELFAGVMAYLGDLPWGGAARQVYHDAPRAWRRLHDAIVWPGPAELKTLTVGGRSRDFGRSEEVAVIAAAGSRAGHARIRPSLWREGAVVDSFPVTRWAWLGGIHAAHLGRSALGLLRRSA